jgi:hypothetical protein
MALWSESEAIDGCRVGAEAQLLFALLRQNAALWKG